VMQSSGVVHIRRKVEVIMSHSTGHMSDDLFDVTRSDDEGTRVNRGCVSESEC